MSYPEQSNPIEFRLQNPFSMKKVEELFAEIKNFCQNEECKNIVVDFSGLEKEDFSITERYRIGAMGAECVMAGGRIAVLLRPEQLDTKRFGELVAQNRSSHRLTRAFTDQAQVIEWFVQANSEPEI